MNIKTKEIYSEVYQVLNLLGNEYIDKLPTSLINMLKEKREINYNPQYTDDIPLNEQNIRKETMSIIVLLYLNYWCENEKEKLEVKQILKSNEDKYQLELTERFNPDNLFKKKEEIINKKDTVNANNKEIIEYKKQKWYHQIFERLLNIFRKK